MTLSNHQILLCFAADFIAVVGYFTAAYYIQFRRERRRAIQAESRERQAKLEAFWKEEQLRLNPPPKPIRISQQSSHIEDGLWEMTLWDMRDNEERKSRAAGK